MKKYVLNTSWMIFERAIRVVLNLFIWGKIAHGLGVEAFGVFSYFQALIFLIGPFCSLGIDQVIRNKISLYPELASLYLSSGIQIKFYSALLVSLISLLVCVFYDFGVTNGNLIFFGFLIGFYFKAFGVLEYFFDWKLESKVNGSIRTISFLIICCLYLAAVNLNLPVYCYAIIFSIEFLLNSIMLIYAYLAEKGNIDFVIKGKFIAEILRNSMPIFMCDIAVCIFLRVNQIFLGNLLSSGSVGIYSAAIRFSEFWYFIPSGLLVSTFSLLTVAHSESEMRFKKYAGLLLEVMLAIALLMIVFTFIFSKDLILFVYGPAYLEASTVLNILILSNIFMFWGIVTLFVMVSIWGLVGIFSSTFLNGKTLMPGLPQ